MRRLKGSKVMVLWLLFILAFNLGHGDCNKEGVGLEEELKRTKPTISDRIRSVFALFGTASSPLPVRSFWDRAKNMINQVHARFFPPNLDFRGSEQVMDEGIAGTREKVKEALTRSMEKGKETMEDSAKSAAKMATEAVEKTKEKVKRTLSDHEHKHHHDHGEL